MSMPCCPPDSEKYLAPDYNTIGSTITLGDGTDIYVSKADAGAVNAIIVIPDVFGWNSGR
jgi:hypothetical protein